MRPHRPGRFPMEVSGVDRSWKPALALLLLLLYLMVVSAALIGGVWMMLV